MNFSRLLAWLSLAVGSLLLWPQAGATDIIPIQLSTDTPRRVSFPVPVRVAVAADAPVRAEVMAEHLWLTGRTGQTEKTRLMVQSLRDERRWILEASTGSGRGSAAVEAEPMVLTDSSRPDELHRRYVELTRWGYQQLYSPARLLQPLPATVPFPTPRQPVYLTRCRPDPSPICPHVRARVLASWRQAVPGSSTRYLSAVELTNLDNRPLPTAVDWLRGHWQAVSFASSRLAPAGSMDGRDRSLVLLISGRPFEQTLQQ